MVNVRIDKRIISNHENYICNSEIENTIKALKDNEIIDKLKDNFGETEIMEHIEFCNFILEQLESLKKHECDNIFVGNIDNLVEIIQYVNKRFPLVCGLIDNDKKVKCGNKEYRYWELIFSAFGYNKFSAHGISRAQSEDNPEAVYIYNYNKDKSVNEWGAYAYVLSLGLKVCPYCNRNYIAPIYSENGKLRADLDHFFPKSKYPYLSVSLYNLVPSCKFCNSSLKGKTEFSYSNNFHPFSDIDVDKLYRFTYLPKSVKGFFDVNEFDVEILYNEEMKHWDKIRNNNNIFCIKDLYQYHKDVICRLIKKRYTYSEEYIEYLYQHYNNIFKNKSEIIDLLLLQFDSSETNNTPLGKMCKDIIKELDFL